MNQKKINKIISLVREEMSVGGAPTNHTGPNVAEFSPVMAQPKRRIKLPPGSRRNWLKALKKKDKKDG